MFELEIRKLSDDLSKSRSVVLNKASQILGREVNVASLNGILGGKNQAGNEAFSCFEEFFACWLKSMYQDYLRRKDEILPMERAGFRNARLLHDVEIMNYAEKFLKRTFLRKNAGHLKTSAVSQGDFQNFMAEIESLKQKFYSI